MKYKVALICLLFPLSLLCAGCASQDTTQTDLENQSGETQVESTVSSTDVVIYAADVSMSLRAIDQYSLTDNGDKILKTYAFDNDCKFYNAADQEITLNEFAADVNDAISSGNKMTKCRLVTEEQRVKEVYMQ